MRSCCALVLTLAVGARLAAADDSSARPTGADARAAARVAERRLDSPRGVATCCYPESCRTKQAPPRRTLATAAAIVPGVFVRGAGSFLVDEKRTARTLAIIGYGGLALAGGAGALIGLSGANPYTTAAVPLVLTGAGAFLTSWAADVFVAASGNHRRWAPRAPAPWSLELGEIWQRDAYRNRLLGRVGGRVELGRVGLGASALLDAGGDAWLGFADVRVRVLGAPPTDAYVDDGSRLYVRAGGRVQRDDEDRVTQVVGELEVGGRLDLARLDPVLRMTFTELSVGIGALRASYAGMSSDVDSLLLTRFAWGMYLPNGSELALFYDHRRDGLAGGIAAYRAAGFVGSAGASLDARVRGPWAIRGELQIGNAWLTTLAVAYRGGGSR